MIALAAVINMLSAAWAFISEFKSVMMILKNWSFVMSALGSVEHIMSNSIQTRGLPSCEDTRKLIDILREALDREMIDIPGVDEALIARQLFQLESTLVCQVRALEESHPHLQNAVALEAKQNEQGQ